MVQRRARDGVLTAQSSDSLPAIGERVHGIPVRVGDLAYIEDTGCHVYAAQDGWRAGIPAPPGHQPGELMTAESVANMRRRLAPPVAPPRRPKKR